MNSDRRGRPRVRYNEQTGRKTKQTGFSPRRGRAAEDAPLRLLACAPVCPHRLKSSSQACVPERRQAANGSNTNGVIVVVLSMSGEDGTLVSGPDIITRGFIYVKESEGLMEDLRQVALEAIQSVDTRYSTDWSAIKGDLSNYLYKKTKRSPMILPVIMEV